MQFNSVCNIHFLLSIDHSYPEKKNTNQLFLRQNISVENSKFTFVKFTIGWKVYLKNFMKLFLNCKSNANVHFFRSDFDWLFSMQWLIMFLAQDTGPRKPSLILIDNWIYDFLNKLLLLSPTKLKIGPVATSIIVIAILK